MKKIYEFNAVDEIKEEGKETVYVPYTFLIKKPSRTEKEEADIVRAQYFSKYVRQGILPEAVLEKTYTDQGGTMNEFEKNFLGILHQELYDKSEEFKLLSLNKDENKSKLSELLKSLNDIQAEITKINYSQKAFYENTAEFKASQKLIDYLFATLLFYKKADENEEFKPYFSGDTFEDKLDYIDSLQEEENSLYLKIRNHAYFVISVYVHLNGNVKEDELKRLVKENEQVPEEASDGSGSTTST